VNVNLNATVDVVVDPDISSIGSRRSNVRAIDRTVEVDVDGGAHVHVHVIVDEI
jgi:hypothetical protein